ncbi:MAG: LysM peptidoglycan-binding domain-containing protein [Actinomycetota bacterium]|nr:LysM peptidoglycan-binding domain-containing protein [Actinomycetota bacterium]
MTSVAQRVRGLSALLALLALVLGVPWALWNVGGAPWPSQTPSLDWFTQELTASGVMSVLSLVLWLAWAHFCFCVVLEAAASVQDRRSGSRRRIPGAAVGTQTLARRLVASVMLLAGSASLAAPVAGAAESRTAPTSVSPVVSSADARAGAGRATPVQAHTGKGTARAATVSEASMRTRLGKTYLVQPPDGRHYDCLWTIAERYLGDGLRWREIYRLNKGIVQADGSSLRDPDLIYPDWVLALPDDAEGPGVISVADRPPDVERDVRHAVHRGGPEDRDRPAGAERSDEPGGLAVGPVGPIGAAGSGVDLAAPLGVAGGLVAAGLLFGLKRRRGWNGGGPRGGGGLKPEDEAGLRLAADSAGAAVLDRSLRQAAYATARAGARMGAVRAAYLDEHSFSVAFVTGSTAAPPEGWRSSPDGCMWTVERAVAERFDPPASVPSPCPGLVTLGAGVQGSLVLVDLGSMPGVTALAGPDAVVREIALSVAVELGTNTWSQDARVSVVGLDPDSAEALAMIAPARLSQAADVDTFLADLDRGRERPTAVIVLEAPDADQAPRLAALTSGPHERVAVLVAGQTHAATWRLDVDPQGRLVNPGLGLDVSAQRLRPELLTTMAALFGAADEQRATATSDLTLTSVPGFDSRLLEAATPAPVSVCLLGPVRVEAPGPLEEERRDLCTEVVAYVALNPTGVHPGVLSSAVWPRGVAPEVFDAAMGHVQRWLGTAATGKPRIAPDGHGRWRLDLREVRVDWHVLQTRYEAAQQTADPLPDLASGLSCVEGQVMTGLPAHRYSWLARSTLVRDMQVLVVRTAAELAGLAQRADKLELAHEALRTGLDVVPDCEQLWRDELRLTHQHEPALLAERTREMYAVIAAHGSPRGPEATTAALVEEMLPGGRPAAVAATA